MARQDATSDGNHGSAMAAAPHGRSDGERAWWGGDVASETELLSAAVLCAAMAASSSSSSPPPPPSPASDTKSLAQREMEASIRSSPLPHRLAFPVLEYSPQVVVMESASSVICAVRATSTSDILEAVLGSAVPLSQPYVYRYGGARIHLPFWKRAQQLDLAAVYRQAREKQKTLLLCGHSIGGSIAQIGLCELVYQRLPVHVRTTLEQMDMAARQRDRSARTNGAGSSGAPADRQTSPLRELLQHSEVQCALPFVMAMGFGSPYIGSQELHAYLDGLEMSKRVVTMVNEFDCIAGILNVAQSASMLSKTTERLLTITRATKTLLNLLPAQMQHVFVGLEAATSAIPTMTDATSGGLRRLATSKYISMSLGILQDTFFKFRELDVIKEMDYQYAPCGTYLFMKKAGNAFEISSDPAVVFRKLSNEAAGGEEAEHTGSALTGNSILQHLMSAYVDAIARRSTSIQINEKMNYYERLGLSNDATARHIRTAYKKLALKWHPDRWSSAVNPREKELAENVFKLLAESYEVLSDPTARKEYDAHLVEGPSIMEEFVRSGTVKGMSLDEAICTFRDVLDGATGAISHVSSRFSSSTSSLISQQRVHRVHQPQDLVANNHNNLFAPGRVRVSRTVGAGADQHEQIMYVDPDDIIPGDVAAPTTQPGPNGGGGARSGLKTVSVLGGAVVVGASVALAVSAWNQYSDGWKKRTQAGSVREMPGEYLMLLMDDHRAQHPRKATKLVEEDHKPSSRPASTPTESEPSDPGQRKDDDSIGDFALVTDAEGNIVDEDAHALTVRKEQELAIKEQKERDEDDELMDEFYECLTECQDAKLQAFAEDEFFECIELAGAVAAHFGNDEQKYTADENEENEDEKPPLQDSIRSASTIELSFPVGSTVSTPYGLGHVEDWRPGCSSAVIRLGVHGVAYLQKSAISRGASQSVALTQTAMEAKRLVLADRVVAKYRLDESSPEGGTFKNLALASKDGAVESGIRAISGMVITKGMTRTSAALGSTVAAPLTVASILVDVGKEYYQYRLRQSDRRNLGVLSATSERLMMQDFRLKAGQHVVSGSAAAAGASLGAYGVASAVGFWTGVGITGPIGVAAATSAAVVGGMLGFFAGSKAYNGYTSSYFTSYKTAKEQIDRLELGARILFNEYDPAGRGEISKEDCLTIMAKLFEASGSVSEEGYQSVITVLQDERFEGPVEWAMFWAWVSTEAAQVLRKLEEEEAKKNAVPVDVEGESWWQSYRSYFSYAKATSTSIALVAAPESALYPAVRTMFKFDDTAPEATPEEEVVEPHSTAISAQDVVVLRAQIEYLVNSGCLSESDAFQLEQFLISEDQALRESAIKTISTLHNGQLDANANEQMSIGFISDGFSGQSDTAVTSNGDDLSISKSSDSMAGKSVPNNSVSPASTSTAEQKTRRLSTDAAQMDVLYSLLSTSGLQHLLHAQHIDVPAETAAHHDQLHCLALLAAAPPATTSSQ